MSCAKILSIVGIICLGLHMFTTSPATTPPPSLLCNADRKDPSAGQICSTLFSLRQIAPPQYPEMAPTPLELLYLDPTDELFLHPELSRHPGSQQHARVHKLVNEAEDNLRAQSWSAYRRGDRPTKRMVDASWLVGSMLRDDNARFLFLTRVQPSLGSGSQSVWSSLSFSHAPGSTHKAMVARTRDIENMCGQCWVAMGLASEESLQHRD